ncbi:uncharacterized protein LOC124170533 isoform X2 [Ischnura elegans]|nr:uncharacterized protein LOC124170533 isoform X2 [Ischnura elegans]
MKVFRVGSKECSALQLGVQNHVGGGGEMLLQSYFFQADPSYSQTGFNVSFYNFTWRRIVMRFIKNGESIKNSCRIFDFSEKFLSLKPTSLFYDCLWSLSGYEGETFNFEYTGENDISGTYRKSVFTVPRHKGINPGIKELNEKELFMYVDITDTPHVILRVQTLPEEYNVHTYNVKAYSGINGTTGKEALTIKKDQNITVEKGDRELIFHWDLGIFPGNYFFEVQPISEKCGHSGCLVSKSPDIKIEPSSSLLIAGGVFLVVVIILFIIACFKYMARGETVSGRPRLLLIYRSTHSSHIKVVLELAQHLRKNCNIEAMFDELDVNKSETHNPFNWYNDAIAQSDFIAIVSSPTCCNSICGIYPKADEMALSLLQGKGFNRKPLSMCNVMVFMLPYCSERTLPQEVKNINLRFWIPKDIDKVVDYIHHFQRKYFIGRFYYCLRSVFFWYMLQGKVSLKKCPGLNDAITEAAAEVKKCLSLEKRTSMTLESEKKIPKITDEKVFHETIRSPLDNINSVSETYSLHQGFPNIEDYNLLGEDSEAADEDDFKPEYREISLLDELNL